MSDERIERCQQRIGYRFRDPGLLHEALTHGSASSPSEPSNERLEFLGDAVLDLAVSRRLVAIDPPLDEGVMTKARARTVSKESLHRLGETLGLREDLIVGKMFSDPARIRPSMLADAVEAIIAAIYLDGGFEPAAAFIARTLEETLGAAIAQPEGRDHKSILGRWSQKNLGEIPIYRVLAREGPDHALMFEVAVEVGGKELARGSGASKKIAEQQAAGRAIDILGVR
ncbi:MAG TPA: ribonuclease III [Planctomycetes bacterium]|nr:ribonuclease III [Planctomycetota bacterium]